MLIPSILNPTRLQIGLTPARTKPFWGYLEKRRVIYPKNSSRLRIIFSENLILTSIYRTLRLSITTVKIYFLQIYPPTRFILRIYRTSIIYNGKYCHRRPAKSKNTARSHPRTATALSSPDLSSREHRTLSPVAGDHQYLDIKDENFEHKILKSSWPQYG